MNAGGLPIYYVPAVLHSAVFTIAFMCSRVYRWLAVHVRDLFSASKKASGRHVETYSRMLLGDAVVLALNQEAYL